MITAILTAHREGLLAKPSLESLKRCVAHAEHAGFSTETIAILDRPDSVTRALIRQYAPNGIESVEVDFGDPGMARNHAIDIANGRYAAFLDADDLWGSNWLTMAAQAAESCREPVIWHPEVCVYFGADHHIFHHIDMEDPLFSPATLAIENYWTALSFGARDIYASNRYPDTDLTAGFGFEDWAWNMNTVAKGILHKTVAGTGHVIRRKMQSVSRDTLGVRGVPRPSPYLVQYLRTRPKRSDGRMESNALS